MLQYIVWKHRFSVEVGSSLVSINGGADKIEFHWFLIILQKNPFSKIQTVVILKVLMI